MKNSSLFGHSYQELSDIGQELRWPPYRARQIFDWIYPLQAENFAVMSNLSKSVRQKLTESYTLERLAPVKRSISLDGTEKYLFRSARNGSFEAALIPEPGRRTLCLSSEAGCRRGCSFCVTGKRTFEGSLSAGEILSQYVAMPNRDKITNIVFMGMGEPLDNLDAVVTSADILVSGFGLGHKRITVSTVGILNNLTPYFSRSSCNLAVSLHSPFRDQRMELVPAERGNPIAQVVGQIKSSNEWKKRRISFEYLMLRGINDTERHARGIIKLLHGMHPRINLIPFNTSDKLAFLPSEPQRIKTFARLLQDGGATVTVRRSRGGDIQAACGLLAASD